MKVKRVVKFNKDLEKFTVSFQLLKDAYWFYRLSKNYHEKVRNLADSYDYECNEYCILLSSIEEISDITDKVIGIVQEEIEYIKHKNAICKELTTEYTLYE